MPIDTRGIQLGKKKHNPENASTVKHVRLEEMPIEPFVEEESKPVKHKPEPERIPEPQELRVAICNNCRRDRPLNTMNWGQIRKDSTIKLYCNDCIKKLNIHIYEDLVA